MVTLSKLDEEVDPRDQPRGEMTTEVFEERGCLNPEEAAARAQEFLASLDID